MLFNSENVVFRPAVGTVCIAVPHGTDWGFDNLDPAGVEIKAYDGDYVWMVANSTHYITTHTERVTFHPVHALAQARQPLTTEQLLAGDWFTRSCDKGSAYILAAMGVKFFTTLDRWANVEWECLRMHKGWAATARGMMFQVTTELREIYRDGIHFYWCDESAHE